MSSWSDKASSLQYEDIPEEVLEVLRLSFMDTLGVAAVGSTTDMSKIARSLAVTEFGAGVTASQKPYFAKLLYDGRIASPSGAAMAGAFTVDSIDAHDGSSPCKGHAGAAVLPSLIALAQAELEAPLCSQSLNGKSFAVALALGYEISYRAGLVQHATCPDYHTSGSWTAVGIAAAGARLRGGTAEIMRQAAGIGEFHGPRSQMMRCIDAPTMVRDGAGWGAASGVTAVSLALGGFTGAPALTCEGQAADPFWEDFGTSWRTSEDTHYKAWPCCRWAHPAIDAALDLMQTHGLNSDQISKIEIRTFHMATRLAGHEPQTLDEFSYALAFPVATAIVRGTIGVQELQDETLQDPAILRLSRATQIIEDETYTRISVGKRWADVTLILQDGTEFRSEAKTPRGDPDDPLGREELIAKFHGFADPTLGESRAVKIRDMALAFDDLTSADLAELIELCCTPLKAF